jgi:hypothetical protein
MQTHQQSDFCYRSRQTLTLPPSRMSGPAARWNAPAVYGTASTLTVEIAPGDQLFLIIGFQHHRVLIES